MMKGRSAFGLLAAVMMVAMAAVAIDGQVRGNYSRRTVSSTIKNLENSSDVFRRDFNRHMDRNDRPGSDRFKRIVENFENAVDRLRSNFDRSNDWWESRGDVQGIMNEARQVNGMMNTLWFARQLESQWRNLRRDINNLARTYSLPGLEGGWNDGGVGDGGNWGTVRPPVWAVGTFYGRSPNNGDNIVLTINENGSITATVGGTSTYGNFTRNSMMYVGGYTSRVYRDGNGIRTVSTTNGETINYRRGGWGNVQPPPAGNVPNWAIGSYVANNPNGGQIFLTIDNRGNVSVNYGGGSTYGTINGNQMYVDGATSTVTRTRNGIRTRSNSDGQVIDYRRR